MSGVNKRPFLLGVDGGGTKTTAWIADLMGSVLGRAIAGPSNVKAVGLEAARRSLVDAITQARTEARLAEQPAEIACLGLAGFDRPEEKRHLEAWSHELGWTKRLILVNDGDLLLAAGTPEGWGAGVISGTGSIAVGQNADGRRTRVGGWGHLIGDEGSGYWVALEALRAIARRLDGRTPDVSCGVDDPLCRRFFSQLGLQQPQELITAIYAPGMDRTRIARLAPLVVAAAEEGSEAAASIVEHASDELALAVLAVLRRLDLASGSAFPLAISGGFLLANPIVADGMIRRLEAEGVRPSRITPVPDPVFGAMTLARRALDS